MMKKGMYLILLLTILSCKENETDPDPAPVVPEVQEPMAMNTIALTTDKAIYNPGDEITFNLASTVPSNARIRYRHLNNIVYEHVFSTKTWTWTAPPEDFKGYMIDVYDTLDGFERVYASAGVDVSSDWAKFPRYGFLSKFPSLTDAQINSVIDNLNKYHINGLQFYDWHYKHHQPLAGTPEDPTPVYKDIINRDIYFATVEKYIGAAHNYNMKAMFYNLVYGALDDANANGVDESWYLFKNSSHTDKDFHPLGPPFISNIYLTDPSNVGWQQYLINENDKVYTALDFDGFHMDQLGGRGTLYNANGNIVNLPAAFESFINAIEAAAPEKDIVMNAVNQYGQSNIANAPVNFLYTEVWPQNNGYSDLARIIRENDLLGDDKLRTVLAAYVNYDMANSTGFFNSPSVLMADAVIFAFGGSHLELGEHMLAKEYFPNSNLTMKEDLKKALTEYYDFLVAYQNLLRDGGDFNAPAVISADNKVLLNNWPAQMGKVAVAGKVFDNAQILHLLNFKDATTLEWRDNSGMQAAPVEIRNFKITVTLDKPVKSVWFASPDYQQGSAREIEFSASGNQVTFTLPYLKYWDMVVIEN